MNKFKKILLGTLSVLTLGLFVVTGTTVNAATVNNTYNFDVTGFASDKLNLGDSRVLTASDQDEMELTITNVASGYGSNTNVYYDSKNSVLIFRTPYNKNDNKVDVTEDNFEIDFEFTMLGTGVFTFVGLETQGDAKLVKYTLDGEGDSVSRRGTNLDIAVNTSGSHTIKLLGTSTMTSNIKVTGLKLTDNYNSSSFESLDSVAVNSTFTVGDTLSKADLTVMSTYSGESSSETNKYTFKVYDANNEEVTGAFTTAGDGYYVVATSTEDNTQSVTSDTFAVGAQTKFVYDFDEFASNSTFSADSNNHDYTTDDNVIAFSQFKKISASTLTFDDGKNFSSKAGLQGSTMTINLNTAAKLTVYARQSGNKDYHAIRYMYLEDEDENSIISTMNFSKSDVSSNVKAFSINLSAGTYTTHSTDGSFNFYAVVIDYSNSATLDTTNTTLILEHSTGTALSGTGTAARFVGVLKNVNINDITSITLDLTLTKSGTDPKNASITITSVYTGLPEYDVEDGTLYFYYVITGLEKTGFEGCTIKGTATIVMGTSKGYSTTTWTNA